MDDRIPTGARQPVSILIFVGMSMQARLKRYLLVLERVAHHPTFADLKDHLEEHGYGLSTRTLQRDIEQIRVELGLEIVYDRPSNTYHLPDADDGRGTILPLLERAVLGALLGSDGGTLRAAAPHVLMERNGQLNGLHHWGTLLRAIRERREVVITYLRFQKDKAQVMRVRPYLLKEYRGRWYLLGLSDGYERPISLGLDRMQGLQVTSKRINARDRDRVEAFYHPVIGVDASPGSVEHVVLRFTPLQGKYIKALPLHSSQQVLQDDAQAVVISLDVLPNMELKQELLGLGTSVRVLEPKWLAKEIRATHREAAAKGK